MMVRLEATWRRETSVWNAFQVLKLETLNENASDRCSTTTEAALQYEADSLQAVV